MLLTDDGETIDEALKEVLIKASGFKNYDTLFELYYELQKTIKKIVTQKDPYGEFKREFNNICLSLEDEMKEMIDRSKDPFETGLRICLAGNSIDVMQGDLMNKDVLRRAINSALKQPLDISVVLDLKAQLNAANEILFVGDNAGEIVFDKVFINLINRLFDKKGKVRYAVRGGFTLNDATVEDAEMVGIKKIAEVITTGIDLPAAYLPLCSDKFNAIYNNADLVIAKGQGNLEALLGLDKNIFFLLKIKCQVISKILSGRYQIGEIAVIKNKKDYAF